MDSSRKPCNILNEEFEYGAGKGKGVLYCCGGLRENVMKAAE